MRNTAYNEATGAMMDTTGIEVDYIPFDEVITTETAADCIDAWGRQKMIIRVNTLTVRGRTMATLNNAPADKLATTRYIPLTAEG